MTLNAADAAPRASSTTADTSAGILRRCPPDSTPRTLSPARNEEANSSLTVMREVPTRTLSPARNVWSAFTDLLCYG